MNSLLGLIIQIINIYQFILLIYITATWLLNFNVINSSNRFVYSVMEAMYRLCEPSLNLARRYIPNFGTIDISPIVVYLEVLEHSKFISVLGICNYRIIKDLKKKKD